MANRGTASFVIRHSSFVIHPVSFLNPLLLLGVLGVASPILIHLLAKKQIKRVVWAAMRFLKVTVDRQQRKMNLEDIILLILRCLVVALLALALARPTLKSGALSVLGGDETAIVLLDNSGSMSTGDGVATRFEKAQKAAEQIVDSIPTGSAVAVWLVSDTVRDVIPEPTRDLALARKAIRDAKRGDQATDWQPALRRALDVMQRQTGIHKRLYVVTDAQAAGWRGTADARNMLEASKSEVQARMILIGEGEQRNAAVTNVRLASALATVNQPLRFEVYVANFGPDELRNVAVSLATDDDPPADEQTLEVVPSGGAPKAISLFVTFREPGFHTVTARIHADRCTFDDTRTFALRVTDEVNVLLVDGDPGVEPRDSEVFYLRNALTPVPPELLGQYFIKTKSIAASELENAPLRDFEAVVLANVVDMSGPALASLEHYVRMGGGLVVFPGARLSVPFYNERFATMLPAQFGPARGEAVDESKAERPQSFFSLQAKDYAHRIAEPWRDPKSGTLTSAQFYRALTLLPAKATEDAGAPAVVLAFADGAPAVMERTFGFGRVVQFASTADTGWNDLPVRPVFLPLMHRTLGHLLARQEERLNVRAGSKFSYAIGAEQAGRDVTVVEPGGKKETSRAKKIELKNGAPMIEHAETFRAGAYEAHFDDDAPRLRFAAFSDPGESDLAEMAAADLKTLGDLVPSVRWSPGTDLRAMMQRERTGSELWLAFAIAVLALAVAETILGNRWSRAR
jgi:von Willebrand factor type A domain/Aerotolerance regulator N-terminal